VTLKLGAFACVLRERITHVGRCIGLEATLSHGESRSQVPRAALAAGPQPTDRAAPPSTAAATGGPSEA
jgi:hypothetical protein